MIDTPRPLKVGKALRRVLVTDLVRQASIGIYARERQKLQRVRINIDLGVREGDLSTLGDRLPRVLDYEWVIDAVRRVVDAGHVNLVETLAERVAAVCFEDHRVRDARVRVEKLDAFPDVAAVGVQIERRSPYP